MRLTLDESSGKLGILDNFTSLFNDLFLGRIVICLGDVDMDKLKPDINSLFARIDGWAMVEIDIYFDTIFITIVVYHITDIFEPKRLYQGKGEVELDRPRADARPMGLATVVRAGRDVTLVAYGAMVRTALDAATAADDEGVSLEVIDLRSLSPLDHATVDASVRRTGRLVVVHEAPREAGLAAEVITGVAERCFAALRSAPVRITGHDLPYPPAKTEQHFLPDLDRILDGVDRALGRPNSMTGMAP